MAEIIGGSLAMLLLTLLVERFAFKDKPPTSRANWTVGVAWVIAAIIAGFGYANGGPFAWWAGLIYLPGAAIVWFFYRRRLNKAWEAGQSDTFA